MNKKSTKVNKSQLKMCVHIKNTIMFVTPKVALLTQKANQFSFIYYSIFTNNNTPPMPLHDAHLGGFLFL